MCGIAGIISYDLPVDESDCVRFIDALQHRGPDGRGVYFEPESKLFFGHRRLKILDTSNAGYQPMFSRDGRYVIVFNGEIYNFLELRDELVQKGYVFVSDTDTEVILASFQEWGEECQLKFNGMWAFALWDRAEKTLFLSRDRFGVKPLYIRVKKNSFSFASEIKAFDFLEFDLQKVADCIEDPLCLESTEETLFKDIRKIPAGCCLLLRHGKEMLKRWWNTLDHIQTTSPVEISLTEKFRDLFLDACSIRMRSDVPIGTALSGGLDSSSILCSIFHLNQSAKRRWPNSWQTSFTAAFPHSTHNELEYAKIAVKHTNAAASFLTVQPQDLIQHFEKCLYSIEDIFDPPIGPWLLYRTYREQGTVISIDGHGADELLCGYHDQFEKALLEACFPIPNLLRAKQLLPWVMQMHSPQSEIGYTHVASRLLKNAFQSACCTQNSQIYQFFKRIYWGQYSGGKGRYGWLKISPKMPEDSYFEETRSRKQFQNLSLLNRSLYIDFHFRTLPSILRNFDRCSMAHGVEIRAPFMDWRIVSFAFSLPSELKAGMLGSKQILRRAMKEILPEEIRMRKSKIGFASPLIQWIESDLKEYIADTIHSVDFCTSEVWEGKKILSDVNRYLASKNYPALRKVWEYVLAHRLITLFKAKSSTGTAA